ncbi:hypothetical protein NVS89_21645 [Ancylobacter sp. MQZ15Z-1]|uniref:Uncharacterized protein n=1 Tax=Ancylobacter mangrovi TaxID=2972472 RepID=A0A9X2PIG0_9HYPH|nr:hypothetical protein [Ancylobacter mangrovi]MCS0497701.1 hypothetical protein [Ancylobacter mangrovi]
MCGLCGVLGGAAHWSEGIGGRDGSGTARPWLRRQARQRSVALANEILRRHRVTVRDWQGTSFTVTGPTGRVEIAADLGELWVRVQAVTGRPLDPLDPALLEALDG